MNRFRTLILTLALAAGLGTVAPHAGAAVPPPGGQILDIDCTTNTRGRIHCMPYCPPGFGYLPTFGCVSGETPVYTTP